MLWSERIGVISFLESEDSISFLPYLERTTTGMVAIVEMPRLQFSVIHFGETTIRYTG
jgi:hypothetical protein